MLYAAEGDGLLDNHLFLEIDGQIEPTVSFKVILESENDVEAPKQITISSEDGFRVPIPLRVIDDDIVEPEQCVLLTVAKVSAYSSLYAIHQQQYWTRICIKDNDGM